MRNASRHLACTLLAGVALLLLPAVAQAKLGVGSTLPSIKTTARPGIVVELPEVPIYNTGDETTVYQMNTFSLSATDTVDPSWVTYRPKTFELAPGASQDVKVTLDLPLNAPLGVRRAILAAQVVNPGTGVVINAALGPKLTLTIEESNWFWRAYGVVDRNGPWSYYALALIAVLVLGLLLVALLRTRRRHAAGAAAADSATLSGQDQAEPASDGEIGIDATEEITDASDN